MTIVIPSASLAWGTPTPPHDPLVISNITEGTATTTGIPISWDVAPGAQGRVVFDTVTRASGDLYTYQTALESSYLTHHEQALGDGNPITLSAGTTYYYRVKAISATAQVTYSSEGTFVTESSGSYPALVTLAYHADPGDTMPGYLSTITDTLFGSEVIRVSNTDGARTRYSTKSAWNRDASILMLDGNVKQTHNGTTYALMTSGVDTQQFFTWSNVNPNVAWGTGVWTTVRKLAVDAVTGDVSVTRVDTPTALSGTYTVVIFGGGGMTCLSNDDHYGVILFKKSNNDIGIATLDMTTNPVSVIAERVLANSAVADTGSGVVSVIDDAGISQSGRYAIVSSNGNDGTGVAQGGWVYDTTTLSTTTRRQVTTAARHMDVGVNAAGHDVLVVCSQASGGGSVGSALVGYDLDNHTARNILTSWVDGHVSCRNLDQPGWCYPTNYTGDGGTQPGFHQIISVNLDDSTVRGYCYAHGQAISGATDYDGSTFAVPSPDGRRVAFNSRWHASPCYAFVTGVDV